MHKQDDPGADRERLERKQHRKAERDRRLTLALREVIWAYEDGRLREILGGEAGGQRSLELGENGEFGKMVVDPDDESTGRVYPVAKTPPQPVLSRTDRQRAIQQTQDILRAFASLDRNMQMSTALTLTTIMAHQDERDGVSTKDLEKLLDMTSGTASRNAQYWAEGNKESGVSGFEMVKTVIDKRDRRRRILSLTYKGMRFLKQLTEVVNKERI